MKDFLSVRGSHTNLTCTAIHSTKCFSILGGPHTGHDIKPDTEPCNDWGAGDSTILRRAASNGSPTSTLGSISNWMLHTFTVRVFVKHKASQNSLLATLIALYRFSKRSQVWSHCEMMLLLSHETLLCPCSCIHILVFIQLFSPSICTAT